MSTHDPADAESARPKASLDDLRDNNVEVGYRLPDAVPHVWRHIGTNYETPPHDRTAIRWYYDEMLDRVIRTRYTRNKHAGVADHTVIDIFDRWELHTYLPSLDPDESLFVDAEWLDEAVIDRVYDWYTEAGEMLVDDTILSRSLKTQSSFARMVSNVEPLSVDNANRPETYRFHIKGGTEGMASSLRYEVAEAREIDPAVEVSLDQMELLAADIRESLPSASFWVVDVDFTPEFSRYQRAAQLPGGQSVDLPRHQD